MKNKETQVIVEKKRKERFELQPTFLPGVQLKLEPGTKLDLPSRAFELFYELVQGYAKKQWKIDGLSKGQKERREEIINTAKANDGLRGIISEKDKLSLTVFPSEKVIWDREKLREAMGIFYPDAVKETTTASITIPTEIDPERLIKKLRKALSNLGIDKKKLDKLIHKESSIDVDQEELNKMIANKQVKLLPETKKIEVTWKVRLDPLKP